MLKAEWKMFLDLILEEVDDKISASGEQSWISQFLMADVIWIRAVSSSCQEKYAKSFVWACIFEIKVELTRTKSYYFVVDFIAVLHFSNISSINRFTSSIDALLIMYKSAISFVNSSRNNIWNLDFIRTEAEEEV